MGSTVSSSPSYSGSQTLLEFERLAEMEKKTFSVSSLTDKAAETFEPAPPPYSLSNTTSASTKPSASTSRLSVITGKLGTWLKHKEKTTSSEAVDGILEPMLAKFDTIIILDDSGSMAGKSWEEARNALAALAKIASKYDENGIDIHFMNNQEVGENLKDVNQVMELFEKVRPRGATPLGETLRRVIMPYIRQLDNVERTRGQEAMEKIKPVNYIVITDGAPTDDSTEDVIRQAAIQLDKKSRPRAQVGIQFVQIGDSSDAKYFLEHLDDDLVKKYGIRDMVDTTKAKWRKGLNAEVLIKALVGSFNRRVDEEGGKVFRKDIGNM
ncbi:hypothetical protein K435DRAFT_758648 [Dendrothele bispora CBS 962.96]|uniref:VWFA domain-containing protein n=1 Tax=Dendrothele bispora (strain CBS 962.96) TaxID=1314807 RepID=A0A4S8LS92_DENBC|nr:hypothetical protein K435DRAFT_758648 [Dendrothele bispora CBS 962.96]